MADTPFTVDYSLTERPGYLRLYGGPYNLSVPASPTLFLRKQIHRFCTWETKLTFQPTSIHTEAGTVVWWNYFTYSSLGIRKKGDDRIICFRPSEGELVERQLDLATDVVLVVQCGNEYRFGYRESSSPQITWIGTLSNKAATRSPPIGAPFTGTSCLVMHTRAILIPGRYDARALCIRGASTVSDTGRLCICRVSIDLD